MGTSLALHVFVHNPEYWTQYIFGSRTRFSDVPPLKHFFSQVHLTSVKHFWWKKQAMCEGFQGIYWQKLYIHNFGFFSV